MKKIKIVLISILFISHAVLFFVGVLISWHNTNNWLYREKQVADIRINLSYYSVYRDYLSNIDDGKINIVKCSVLLSASSLFDDIKECMSKESCKRKLPKSLLERMPEVLGSAPIPFDYIPSDGAGRSCVRSKK